MLNKWRYHVLTFIWAIVIAVLTLLPVRSVPKVPLWNIPHFDKIVHTAIFAVLAFLMAGGIIRQLGSFSKFKTAFYITLPLAIAYGGLTEYLQNFIPGRSVELFDLAANTAGIVLGLSMCYFLLKLKSNRS